VLPVPEEVTVEGAVNIIEVHDVVPKNYQSIRFITVGSVCVYDYMHTNTWTGYRDQVLQRNRGCSEGLQKIKEESCDEEEEPKKEEEKGEEERGRGGGDDDMKLRASPLVTFVRQNPLSLGGVLRYLCDIDVVCLLATSSQVRSILYGHQDFRERRKHGIARLTAEQKRDQKKKRKAAHRRATPFKKDGFARGQG